MEGSKLFFLCFCAIIIVISCDQTNDQNKPNHIKLKSRLRKETENDRIRQLKSVNVPVSIRTKPTNIRKSTPATNIFHLQPKNVTPKRNLIPIVNQKSQITLKTNKAKSKKPVLTVEDKNIAMISNNSTNSTKIGDTMPNKYAEVDDLITSQKFNLLAETSSVGKKDAKRNEQISKKADIACDNTSVEKDETKINEHPTYKADVPVDTISVQKEDVKKSNDLSEKDDVLVNTNFVQNDDTKINEQDVSSELTVNDTEEIKNDNAKFIEEDIDRIADNESESTESTVKTYISANGSISGIENLPKQSVSEDRISTSIVNETVTTTISKNTTNIGSETNRKSFPVLIGVVKIPKINKYIPLVTTKQNIEPKKVLEAPIPKTGVNRVSLIPQNNPETANKITNNREGGKVSPQILNPGSTEPGEEIIVNQNNYEELYESPTSPSQFSPYLITSDLRPEQSWDTVHNPVQLPSEGNQASMMNGFNRPYFYDIKQYPNQYVVNTYDNDNYKTFAGTKWSPNYRNDKNQAVNTKEWGNFHQGLNPNNRIWRSWNNNKILIRPRTQISGNLSDIFGQPSGNIVGAYGYQNISPYLQQHLIQFPRRYGY